MSTQNTPHHSSKRLQRILNWAGLVAVLGIMFNQGGTLLEYLQAEDISVIRVVLYMLALVGWVLVEVGFIIVLRNGRK